MGKRYVSFADNLQVRRLPRQNVSIKNFFVEAALRAVCGCANLGA